MKQTFVLAAVSALIGLSISSWAAAPSADAPVPRAAETLADILDQTSAVVLGQVSLVDYQYDDATGPWTVVTLSDVHALLGDAPGTTLTLRTRGGPLPDGRFLVIPELASFEDGGRYVVFLRNTSWSWSPVVKNFALRVVSDAGREVLASAEGVPLEGVGESGLLFTANRRFDVSSSSRVGFAEQKAQYSGGLGPRGAQTQASPLSTPPALTPSELVASLEAELSKRNASLHGTFYDEPRAQVGSWQHTAVAPAQGNAGSFAPTGRNQSASPAPEAKPLSLSPSHRPGATVKE